MTMWGTQKKQECIANIVSLSEKLISEQSDEIYGVNTINWDDSSWKHLSLIGDEEVISLSHAKGLSYFQIMCFALER